MRKRLLAMVCRICPFCVCARRWPESRFAQALRKVEKNCPFCRAYGEVHGWPRGWFD